MVGTTNILQQVITYQASNLAYFQNLNCFVATANTKFKNFNSLTANLGDTVSFDKPPRARAANGLVVTFQGSEQRVQNLVCDQSANVPREFTAQQFIFNVEDYMDKFGKADVSELSAKVEISVARNCLAPYRYFGTPTAPITSFQQMAQMISNFVDFGVPAGTKKVYLPNTAVPAIVGSGLNQFAIDRNNDIAYSWFLGRWSGVEFYQSNLLPKHTAGTLAEAGTTLTLVSTNDPTGLAVTQLTFSGAGTNVNAVKENDLFTFQDGVGSLPDLRFLTWVGHYTSNQPVQFRATADAASSAGSVTINVTPVLCSQQTPNQNLNVALQAGMQVVGVASHTRGMILSDDALFLAMPMLPSTEPFPSSSVNDPDTGVSIRNYYGNQFGLNEYGYVSDCLWGSTVVEENGMGLIFPY